MGTTKECALATRLWWTVAEKRARDVEGRLIDVDNGSGAAGCVIM